MPSRAVSVTPAVELSIGTTYAVSPRNSVGSSSENSLASAWGSAHRPLPHSPIRELYETRLLQDREPAQSVWVWSKGSSVPGGQWMSKQSGRFGLYAYDPGQSNYRVGSQ